jgi:hypothetical protein
VAHLHTHSLALQPRENVHNFERETLLQLGGDLVEGFGLSLGCILVKWCATLP